MTKKKKRDLAATAASLPPGFRVLEIAIEDTSWDTYCRAASRIGCEPGDIVTNILRLGFERLRMFELVEENDKHAKATRH